jgi:hypothetical protein
MPIILSKCPTGYQLNKDNCRCKKIVTKKKAPKKAPKKVKKTKKPKTVKKPIKKPKIKKEKCNTLKKKECKSKNKVCNPDTGRCKNPEVKKTKKKKKTTVNKTVKKKTVKKKTVKKKTKLTKKMVKELKDNPTISRLRSYSPTINKEIERLSISPHQELFNRACDENEIFYPEKQRCFGWKSKKAQKYLLDNLQSKKPLIAENIRAPYQNRMNCWFNTFFMLFFITDKGRKFFKAFRESMITGKFKTTKAKIPDRIRYPFWLLNKMITAALLGKKDHSAFWAFMDTNDVIQEIYKKIGKKYSGKKTVGNHAITKPGEAGNPISMYLGIINYFDNKHNAHGFGLRNFSISGHRHFRSMKIPGSKVYNLVITNKPHIIIIPIIDNTDGDPQKGITQANGKLYGNDKKYAMVKDFKKQKKYTFTDSSGKKMEYKLDSVGIRDVNQGHICALLTLNKKDYMFDGENSSPIYRKDWKKLINRDEDFKITSRISEKYNFTKCYQCLIYFRSS